MIIGLCCLKLWVVEPGIYKMLHKSYGAYHSVASTAQLSEQIVEWYVLKDLAT